MKDARDKLMESLRCKGISDEGVLQAIAETPREYFISDDYLKSHSYDDVALPIECQQTISQPYIVAFMTEHLRVNKDHDVLEVGTGSGYQTAILSRLARHVFTIERHEALHRLAVSRFQQLGLDNITAIAGDGTQGWPQPRLFDRILVAAASKRAPKALLDQLAPCGMMMIPLGRSRNQQLTLIVRSEEGLDEIRKLLPVRFVPLLADD